MALGAEGFRRLQAPASPSRLVDSYAGVMRSEADWRAFEAEYAGRLFTSGVSPFEGAKQTLMPDEASLLDAQRALLEKRFPFANDSAGDGDVRALIGAAGRIHDLNLEQLLASRRRVVVSAAATGLAALGAQLTVAAAKGQGVLSELPRNLDVVAVLLIAAVAAATMLVSVWSAFDRLDRLKVAHDAATAANAGVLAEAVRTRQSELARNVERAFAESRESDVDSKRWASIALWMAGRAETNELALQNEFWRMRRRFRELGEGASMGAHALEWALYAVLIGLGGVAAAALLNAQTNGGAMLAQGLAFCGVAFGGLFVRALGSGLRERSAPEAERTARAVVDGKA